MLLEKLIQLIREVKDNAGLTESLKAKQYKLKREEQFPNSFEAFFKNKKAETKKGLLIRFSRNCFSTCVGKVCQCQSETPHGDRGKFFHGCIHGSQRSFL